MHPRGMRCRAQRAAQRRAWLHRSTLRRASGSGPMPGGCAGDSAPSSRSRPDRQRSCRFPLTESAIVRGGPPRQSRRALARARSRPGSFARGAAPRRCSAPHCASMGLAAERLRRSATVRLASQRRKRCASALRGAGAGSPALRRCGACPRRQPDACAPSLRKPDRDRLLRGSRAVLSFAHVVNLLAHELARLRGRGLALSLVALRALDGFLFRHRWISFASWSSGRPESPSPSR
jgi:hypothetical protein